MYTAAAIHMNTTQIELPTELEFCGRRRGWVCRRDGRVLAAPALKTGP
jgi:hypothetical protein